MDFDIHVVSQKEKNDEGKEESSLLAYDLGKDILVALAVFDPTCRGYEIMEIENYWMNRYEIFGRKSLDHTILTNEIVTLIQTTNPSFSFVQVLISSARIMTVGAFGNFRMDRYRNKKWQPLFNNQNENKIQIKKSKIAIGDLLFISSKFVFSDGEFYNQIKRLIQTNQPSRIICQTLMDNAPTNQSGIDPTIGLIQIKK